MTNTLKNDYADRNSRTKWLSLSSGLIVVFLLLAAHHLSVMSVVWRLERSGGSVLQEKDYVYGDGDLWVRRGGWSRGRGKGDWSGKGNWNDLRRWRPLISLNDISAVTFALDQRPSSQDISEDVGRALLRLKRCRVLCLTDCVIEPELWDVLTSMPNLEYVDLSGTNMTDADLMTLSKSTSIQYLNVFESSVTQDGITRFRKTCPDKEVWNWYH